MKKNMNINTHDKYDLNFQHRYSHYPEQLNMVILIITTVGTRRRPGGWTLYGYHI
jgi:hypothetical protein